MKAAIVQVATTGAATPYNLAVTDGGATPPVGDMVGALFECVATAANNSNTQFLRFGFGATDLTNSVGVGQGGQDAAANALIKSLMSNTNCVYTPSGLGGKVDPVASFGSVLTAGLNLNVTSDGTAGRLINTALLSGSDFAMQCGSQYFAAGDTSHDQAHTFGAPPDAIILTQSIDVPSSANEASGNGFSIGFWDRRANNQVSLSYHATSGAATTDNAAIITNNSAGEVISASADVAHVTITGVNSSKFTITLNTSGLVNCAFNWIAFRGITAQMLSKCGLVTLPTATGNSAIVSGMSGTPQILIVVPTRLTTGNAIQTDDSAGSFGVCMAASNDAITTTVGCNACSYQDGVATSSAHNRISNTFALVTELNTGLPDVRATVNSWDSGGVTLNYSNVNTGGVQAIFLALGMPPVVTLPSFPGSRVQFFTEDRVTTY